MVEVTKDLLEKSFASNPVKDVSLEARFVSNFSIISNPETFQKQLKEDYKESRNENITQSGQQKNYYSMSKDNYCLKYSDTNFVISNFKYSNFNDFKNEAERVFSLFTETYNINSFKRLGLRYINNIKIKLNEDSYNSYVMPVINIQHLKDIKEDKIDSFLNQITFELDEFNLNLMTGFIIDNKVEQEYGVIIIDIDAFTNKEQRFDTMWNIINKYKKTIKKTFLGLITDKTLKQMVEGKPL